MTLIHYRNDLKRLVNKKFPVLMSDTVFQTHFNNWLNREKTVSDIKDFIIIISYMSDVNYIKELTRELAFNPSDSTNVTHRELSLKYNLTQEDIVELENLFERAKNISDDELDDFDLVDNITNFVFTNKENKKYED